ncbi:Gfo/Idh/MocA family oxidoreductase, partial [Pelagibacteraceae bacterium]|nr:Gfo/Idh/MocA family oxidoreductase [Pelagibacteraceae bacterium]
MKNALIVGYGSIGRLHHKILKKMKIFDKIYIYTSQNINFNYKINSLSKLDSLDITYVVIASPTSMHEKHLYKINTQLKNSKILVEKPLFDKQIIKKINSNNSIYVGYDLRYHPVITKLKKIIHNKKI